MPAGFTADVLTGAGGRLGDGRGGERRLRPGGLAPGRGVGDRGHLGRLQLLNAVGARTHLGELRLGGLGGLNLDDFTATGGYRRQGEQRDPEPRVTCHWPLPPRWVS